MVWNISLVSSGHLPCVSPQPNAHPPASQALHGRGQSEKQAASILYMGQQKLQDQCVTSLGQSLNHSTL